MAFGINECGIERGATQLLFESAPIVVDRHEEDPADTAYELALPGNPVATTYNATQAKALLRIKVRYLAGTDADTLVSLMATAGPVTVKLTPGSATTLLCVFGPRKDQRLVPFCGDYATGKMDGTAVDPVYRQYYAELLLLRLE